MIRKLDDAVTYCNEQLKRLDEFMNIDPHDDGRDSHNYWKNLEYRVWVSTINEVRDNISKLDIEGISDDELDKLWKDAWGSYADTHFPEVKANHIRRYVASINNLLNKEE